MLFRPPIKKALLVLGLVVLAPAIGLVITAAVWRNRTPWTASRELANALENPRSVTIEEYAGKTTIARKTATPDEIARLRKATGLWFCDLKPKGGFLCFEPHHRVDIVRADGSQRAFSVCFLCEKFLLTKEPFQEGDLFLYWGLPSSWEKSLTSFFTSVGMTPKTDDEYGEIEEPGRKAKNDAAPAARLAGREN